MADHRSSDIIPDDSFPWRLYGGRPSLRRSAYFVRFFACRSCLPGRPLEVTGVRDIRKGAGKLAPGKRTRGSKDPPLQGLTEAGCPTCRFSTWVGNRVGKGLFRQARADTAGPVLARPRDSLWPLRSFRLVKSRV